ncbi:FGGY-family carbohydrate kinase [Halorhodospira halochloris]|uniref:FGGY-family carbohydrate kinase n=1 Tax=Halorhodospira halochloris TaxID=1052 RepID=UPI001EE8484C|nr:FGGY-family carbohydrate kinase [Halorhodospira halochloris]MCG5547421.1 FGGY-family carbohydrate kinase [Halorhodospira halochloris]
MVRIKTPYHSPLATGLDIGTSGCRAVVIDGDCQPLAWGREDWPNSDMPASPEQWWQTAVATLAQVCNKFGRRIRSVAVVGTSGTVLLADPNGTPATQAMRYNEPADRSWSDHIAHFAPAASGAHGNHSGLARALQLAATQGLKEGFLIHSQADWVAARLCNQFGWCDENNALKLGYDPVNRNWPSWLNRLPIPANAYPSVYPSGRPIAQINPASAACAGLSSNCQVITGTTDSIAGFLAAGADRSGEAVSSLGTTLALKMSSETAIFSPKHGVYSHRLGESFLVGGASNCGAGILKRYFTPEQLDELSAKIDPERDTGLDYYPLPCPGERFPHYDPHLEPRLEPRPASDAEFLQGLLEGLAAIEASGYRRLHELGAPQLKRVVSVGGGTANLAWQRIRQRYLGVPVSAATQTEAAFGAALLAHRCIE